MHTNDPLGCPSCEDKLKNCHPDIQSFYAWLKGNHQDVHICWGFRDQLDQHHDFVTGKSKLDWPNSKHNFTEDLKPCSKAVDVFRLSEDGKAYFEVHYYHALWQEILRDGLKIRWGGSFPHLQDLDHYELDEDIKPN